MGLRQGEAIKTALHGHSATRLRRLLGSKSLNLGLKSICTKGPNMEHPAPNTKHQKPKTKNQKSNTKHPATDT
jgi:hypothetical protein